MLQQADRQAVATDGASAARTAAATVEAVQGKTYDRFRLAADFYRGGYATGERRRYGLAELSFLHWEIARGVLAPPAEDGGGSPWWRAINDGLLRDKVEADLLAAGSGDEPSSRTVGLWLEFIAVPSAATWYRAHNASVVAGYLKHEPLAANELWVERFMMNVALVRVLYAHALAAAPQLALGLFAPLGRWLGDPRRRAVRLFLDLRNVFPDAYPLDGWELEELLAAEQQLGRALDYGLIASRLTELYEFAAAHIDEPRITRLESDGAPCYSWPREHRELFLGGTSSRLARAIAIATGRRQPVR
jgi:hypothetical protein